MVYLNKIREKLLYEAKNAPSLLSDLAGLEKYIAESYNSRSFIELLQNADDAEASKLLVKKVNKYLLICNNGRKFTEYDFESLCRSAASQKDKKTKIGFKGIGFKSVLSFSKKVHLISGDFKATFCKNLTKKILPHCTKVPLIRIPHELSQEIKIELKDEIQQLQTNGYSTIFIFSGIINHVIEEEFENISSFSLLFLNNVKEIFVQANKNIEYSINKNVFDNMLSEITLFDSNIKYKWYVFKQNNVSIAISNFEDNTRILESEFTAHSFLPTTEKTGFNFKVNGNFTTDPSRKKIIFDDTSMIALNELSHMYIFLLTTYLFSNKNYKIAKGLLPLTDPNLLVLQKTSFYKKFLECICRNSSTKLMNYYYYPSWLNAKDCFDLLKESGIQTYSVEVSEMPFVCELLSKLNITEAILLNFDTALSKTTISHQGISEIMAYILNQNSMNQFNISNFNYNWKLWISNSKIYTLNEIIKNKLKLDEYFINLVIEKSIMPSEFDRLLQLLVGKEQMRQILPNTKKINNNTNVFKITPKFSTTKWRSAEQLVLEYFNSRNINAKDVSLQNLGYDIEINSNNNITNYIEVKSINYCGQSFTLTNNEIAFAKEKQNHYSIALVCQNNNNNISLMFINNPLNSLSFDRQCKQWVWLCSDYKFIENDYC